MNPIVVKVLVWSPRILCILFALFLSLFALDVFGQGAGFWETILAFLIHLVPTYLVLITLALAWRWPWIGGVLGALLGLGYIWMAWGKFSWMAYALISGPLFLVSGLFWASWFLRDWLSNHNFSPT